MTIKVALFQALKDKALDDLRAGIPSSGTKFENFMVQQLCQKLRQLEPLRVFQPRYTLRKDTCSGLAHQFDIVIQQDKLMIAIECKFRGKTGIDDLFAFVGKLVDYREPPRGIFVTTAKNVNDSVFRYAIAHRVLIVCSSLPPVEYMIQQAKKNTNLAHHLARLQTRLRGKIAPNDLLLEWQNAYSRFTTAGYD